MITFEHDDVKFVCTDKQRKTLETLMESNTGFATVHEYVSTTGRVLPETSTINFIAKFSMAKLNAKKREFLASVTLSDISESVQRNEKLLNSDPDQLAVMFEARKQREIDSLDKTASGDRSDALRQAHDRCYGKLGNGLRVHYKTLKIDGISEPVTINGVPVADSIMVSMIEIGRKVCTAGEYKKVNSGIPVLLSNAIKSIMPTGLKMKTLSLKDDNFSSLSIGGNIVVPDDVKSLL